MPTLETKEVRKPFSVSYCLASECALPGIVDIHAFGRVRGTETRPLERENMLLHGQINCYSQDLGMHLNTKSVSYV